ncbi:hypothetical protein, partial [Pseudomonas viridiflava]
ATILAIFWVPMFYVAVSSVFKGKDKSNKQHVKTTEAGQ